MYDTIPAFAKSAEPAPVAENEQSEVKNVLHKTPSDKKVKKEESSTDDEVSFSDSKTIKKGTPKKQQKMSTKLKSESDSESEDKKKKASKSVLNKTKVKSEDQVVYSSSESSSSSEDDKKGKKSEVKPKVEEKSSKPVTVKKRKKTMKDEFKMDMRDMIVKKRIASLNASAIMTASSDKWKSSTPKVDNSSVLKAIEYVPSTPAVTASPFASPDKVEPEKKQAKKGEKKKKGHAEKSKHNWSFDEPDSKKKTKKMEQNHIIVEIEDERIKSQLIASAMKKTAGKSASRSGLFKGSSIRDSSSSENNTVVVMRSSTFAPGTKSHEITREKSTKKKKYQHHKSSHEGGSGHAKKRRMESNKKIVVDGSSSSEDSDSSSSDYSSEELEEIVTDGARTGRASTCPSSGQIVSLNLSGGSSNPVAMKTEMNKVDLIVDGRVPGMYQVVHRFETISTTTAVVPRTPGNDQQVGEITFKL
jgi:hypothetical protein